jgi:excisionase family DNA binding protein
MADATTPKTSTSLSDLDIPVLDGWVLIAEAAEMLGVTRQHAYRLVRNGDLTNVRRLGTSSFYVVKTADVDKRISDLAERKAERAEKASAPA